MYKAHDEETHGEEENIQAIIHLNFYTVYKKTVCAIAHRLGRAAVNRCNFTNAQA